MTSLSCSGLLLLILLFFPAVCGFAAPVAGKLSVRTQGVGGAQLLAWPASAPSFAAEAPFRSAPTGADGRYQLDLPAGEYYLFGAGPDLFAFYGRNPVTVPAAGLQEVNIGLLPRNPPLPEGKPALSGGVFGQVTVKGKPLAGATIYIYADLTSGLKGASLATAISDDGGLFEVQLPAGTYYLLVRYRRSNETAGPLRAGDSIGYYAANPLRLGDGEIARVAVPVLEVPDKVDKFAESLFGETSIHGRLLDKAGQPVAGARAVLYDEPTMLNRPLYVSQPTGADGRFVLSLPAGGRFYIAGRNTLGGAPSPGDLYGTFDGRPDHSVHVETGGDLEGVDIVLEEMW